MVLADSTGKSRPKRSRSTSGAGKVEPNREMEGRGQGKAAFHLTCHQDRDWPFDNIAERGDQDQKTHLKYLEERKLNLWYPLPRIDPLTST